jgi:thiol peroxidase
VVIDEKGSVLYTEQVAETTEEPNYKAALESLMNE